MEVCAYWGEIFHLYPGFTLFLLKCCESVHLFWFLLWNIDLAQLFLLNFSVIYSVVTRSTFCTLNNLNHR